MLLLRRKLTDTACDACLLLGCLEQCLLLRSAELTALRADRRKGLLLGLRELAELRADASLLLSRLEQRLLLLGAELPSGASKLRLPRKICLRSGLRLAEALT